MCLRRGWNSFLNLIFFTKLIRPFSNSFTCLILGGAFIEFSTCIHKISCLLFKLNTNVRTFILCYLITYILRGFLFWERIMVFCDNFCMSDLNITSWNIHGIFNRIEGFRYNKTHSPHFWDMIGDSKIFGLIETHHLANEIDQIQIAGFKCFNVSRKKSW